MSCPVAGKRSTMFLDKTRPYSATQSRSCANGFAVLHRTGSHAGISPVPEARTDPTGFQRTSAKRTLRW
jgi:hypothetical protein